MATKRQPDLEEVKERVFTDHRRILALLDRIDALRDSLDGSAEDAIVPPSLTEAMWKLFLDFDTHLAMEERELVPVLEGVGAWGAIRVGEMRGEHRAQRTMLLAMVDECDAGTKTLAEIADDLRWLSRSLRDDIKREESEFEAIRDDGFVANQFTG